MKTVDLGTCPFVVSDKDSAERAGEWAENMARLALGLPAEAKRPDAMPERKRTEN
jgi:hypothetical protein